MKTTILLFTLLLISCDVPEVPYVPRSATCTADGWHVNVQTGEIITRDDGQAIICEFK